MLAAAFYTLRSSPELEKMIAMTICSTRSSLVKSQPLFSRHLLTKSLWGDFNDSRTSSDSNVQVCMIDSRVLRIYFQMKKLSSFDHEE
jgi:hypothetical protein